MRPEWRRFAPIGLYLTLVGAVAGIILYIIQREWNIYLQISLALTVIGLAVFAVLDPDRVRKALTGRQARYGSNAIIMAIAFVGILAVVNYLGYQNNQRWDLTEGQQNTLAPETVDTLESLPQEVQATAFFTTRANPTQAETLLEQYRFQSDGNFNYQFVDPEEDPIAAQNAGITRDRTIILRMGDRQETVTIISERELTAAMIRLISDEVQAVYFLTGHGEHNPTDSGEEAFSQVRSTLEDKSYMVEVLNLLTSNNIPEDARVIVIAGPVQPLALEEVDLLNGFLEAGGSLIVMQEPLPVTEFGESADPLAEYLTENWGINLGQDIVVDLTSQSPFVAWANEYASHPITERLQGLVTAFPTARSVQVTRTITGTNQTELVFTAQQAWAETDLESVEDQDQQITPDEGVDLVGRVPLGIVAERTDTGGRLVVFGDSDFASDANFDRYGNGDLMINSVDWSAEQEILINLTPKETVQRVVVPPQQYTMGLVLFGSVFLLPGMVLVAGIVVFFQRRSRG